MKTYNHHFVDIPTLTAFMRQSPLQQANAVMVQVFTGVCELDFIHTLIDTTRLLLPQAKLIGSTTDGEIMDGDAFDSTTVLAFSVFEQTEVITYAVRFQADSYATAQALIHTIQRPDEARAFISFVRGLKVNGEEYLKAFDEALPHLIVAGGLAGDNAEFQRTYVFTERGVDSACGAVGAALYNPNLHVNTHYNFGWNAIGKTLRITKSEKNRVYTIDGIPAARIYSKYLGDKIEQMLPATGIEFPLIIQKNDLKIARAVLQKHADNSLSFAGNIDEGTRVQFGYGNIKAILNEAPRHTQQLASHPIESIFTYSCMARKRLLGEGVKAELSLLAEITSMSGFFTYGEFFHDEKEGNQLLNQTMTMLTLSEDAVVRAYDDKACVYTDQRNTQTVMALSHLISVTSEELQTLNDHLEAKVSEKTAELQILNKELEQRVDEKTKKLQVQYQQLKDTQQKLIENEKFASLGTLVAGVAHEINTPVGLSLTGITHIESELQRLLAQFDKEQMTKQDFTRFMEHTTLLSQSIKTSLVKAVALVKSFKQVAIDQTCEEDRRYNLKEYVDEVILSLHNKIKLTKTIIEVDIEESLFVMGNPGFLSQILTNLVMNSLIHGFEPGEQGLIEIHMYEAETDLVLAYSDDGKGLSDEVKSKIFEPFYTTKRGQGGSGLGMNIIYNIIRHKLNGEIKVMSEEGHGTQFLIHMAKGQDV